MDLTGKVIAVTGGTQGLGAGLVRTALARGMEVATCSRSAPQEALPRGVLDMRVDVRDVSSIETFADAAFERFGGIDLWVNNAGLLEPVGPLRDADPEKLRALLDVNVLGVALGSQVYARLLRARQQRGVLMNISSGAARRAYFGWGGYCASKAAVDRLSEVIAIEEEDCMRVYSIAPGVIETRMQEAIRAYDEQTFRDVARFRKLKETGSLQTPDEAAAKLLRVAFDPHFQIGVCLDVRDLRAQGEKGR